MSKVLCTQSSELCMHTQLQATSRCIQVAPLPLRIAKTQAWMQDHEHIPQQLQIGQNIFGPWV